MIKPHLSLVKSSNSEDYYTVSHVRQFTIIADEPIIFQGTDLGPSPFDLLNVSLASCTAMFLCTQAEKSNIAVGEIIVKIKIVKVDNDNLLFERSITFENKLNEDDKSFFLEASKHTPITKIISNAQRIETVIVHQ